MKSYIGKRASFMAAENIFPCNNYFCKCIEYLDFGRPKHRNYYKNCYITNGSLWKGYKSPIFHKQVTLLEQLKLNTNHPTYYDESDDIEYQKNIDSKKRNQSKWGETTINME